MNSSPDSLPYFFLKPGDMAISEEPGIIATLLGSCVAVTMLSRRSGMGAVCHALLPTCRDKDQCHRCPERFRHVDCAIRGMIEAFVRRGVSRGGIEAKLFGGADMFRTPLDKDGKNSVGRQNVERAREILRMEGVGLAAADVGGTQGRKIFFNTGSGEVFLRRLNGIDSRRTLSVLGGKGGVKG